MSAASAPIATGRTGRGMIRYSGRRILASPAVAPLIVFVIALAIWQLGGFHALFGLKTYSVPYPSAIMAGLTKNGSVILGALSATLPAALLGWISGMSLGFLTATVLVRVAPGAIALVLPTLSASNSLPIVALAPLMALFVGPGIALKVIVVTIMTAPIMAVYAVRGLTNVEPNALELMASIEATRGQVFGMLRRPTALPFLFAALKSSVVLALIGTIVSEAVRGFEGLGYVIVDSTGLFNAPKAWLALIAIGATGIAWYLIVEVVERLVLPWEAAGRRQD
ncbi:MAG: ABC transporter permease [Candidatus Limnocylindrales bacterium]